MDQSSFDRIARLLGAAVSRRAGLAAVAGAAFGAPETDALARKDRERGGGDAGKRGGDRRPRPEGPCGNGSRKDNICTRNAQCCTNICNTKTGKHNVDGRGRCRCLRNGRPCAEDRNCCQKNCLAGRCNGARPPVPSGDPCVAGLDTCQDPNASCAAHAYDTPAGTYCVLPKRALCSADYQCASNDCTGGVCVSCSSPACGVPCDAIVCAGCAYQTVQAAITGARAGAIIDIGAGTYLEDLVIDKDITLRACKGTTVVIRNTAYAKRTIDNTGGHKLTIINVIIDGYQNYKTANYGGGIETTGDVTLAGTSVVRRGGWLQGGGIYAKTSTPITITVTDRALMERNAADTYGGAMYVEDSVSVVIDEDAAMRFNHADTYGGVITARGVTAITLAGNALIDGNDAPGAPCLYVVPANPIVLTVKDNVVMSNNVGSWGYGGALYMDTGAGDDTRRIVVQDNVKLINNAAAVGGAIFAFSSQVSISGEVEISGNRATDAWAGGGIHVSTKTGVPWTGTALTITGNVVVSSNHATGKGGGIVSDGAPVVIGGAATVSGNVATAEGGGIGLQVRRGPVSLTLQDSALVTGNTATSGGGIYSDSSSNTVTINGSASVTANTPDNCIGAGGTCAA